MKTPDQNDGVRTTNTVKFRNWLVMINHGSEVGSVRRTTSVVPAHSTFFSLEKDDLGDRSSATGSNLIGDILRNFRLRTTEATPVLCYVRLVDQQLR